MDENSRLFAEIPSRDRTISCGLGVGLTSVPSDVTQAVCKMANDDIPVDFFVYEYVCPG